MGYNLLTVVGRFPGTVCLARLHVLLLLALAVSGASARLPEKLSDLTPGEFQQGVIALVNIATTPGVDSASFSVSDSRRDSELSRTTLGFSGEYTIREKILNGYWGASLARGDLDEIIDFQTAAGAPISIELDRSVTTMQGSAGLVLPIDQHLRLRPYLTLNASRIDADSVLSLKQAYALPDPELPALYSSWRADAITTSATFEGLYDRWYGTGRLELGASYTLSYTDSHSDDSELPDSHGWHDTLVLRSRWSLPLRFQSVGGPWRWSVYANHVNFLNQEKIALGFTEYFDVGAAISYEINIRPLDWFGLRYVGFRAGAILGADVSGYSLGLSFR